MTAHGGPVIETEALSRSFHGIPALRSLNLTVERHSIFGFLGPNGAGKSTTIKLLLGLIRPTAGSAKIFGHDIVSESAEIRRRVGYLAQEPRFYDHMTARETLGFAARFFYAGPNSAIDKRVEEVLELVGLSDKADRPIRGFSGGERQRLGIAQAQINTPDLLILDEPAAALDPQGRHDVLEIMERLRENTTIFFSTHILDDVQRVSDTVAILNRGELVAQAPIEKLLKGSENRVYSLTLKGKHAGFRERLMELAWISSIARERKNGEWRYQIFVKDEALAEARLLRTVLEDEQVTVTEFHQKKHALEDVFLHMVEENDNDQ